MIVLDIPDRKDGSNKPHHWRQKPDRDMFLLVEHLPSLDHDGEADQTSPSGVLRQKSH